MQISRLSKLYSLFLSQQNEEEHRESLVRDSQQREPDSSGETESPDAQHPETASEGSSSESSDVDENLDSAEAHGNGKFITYN